VRIEHRIDELYTQYPFYGSRRMTAQLQREGVEVNCKAVQRHMREMGIAAIYPGPNLSRKNYQEQISPYLLRNVTPSYPNHIWGIDVRRVGA
jgi:putative transposase